MSQGEMIGRQGKRYVSMPLPQIDIPRFRYGPKEFGGVGRFRSRWSYTWTICTRPRPGWFAWNAGTK